MYDLTNFDLSDMTSCGAELRDARSARSMEEAANRIVSRLYETLTDSDGRRGCSLVRLFATIDHGELDPELRAFGKNLMAGHALQQDTKCLTLLATVGEEKDWNSRRDSRGHQSIPLPSESAVSEIPMIAQLIRQLGLEVASVLRPDPELIMETEQRTFNVFHVPEALGSPFIPAQDFVAKHGIQSVLGVGGLFPTGNMFVLLMFTKVAVPLETAEMFRTAALNTKIALLPFVRGPFFSSTDSATSTG